MILDSLEHAGLYAPMGKRLARALEILVQTDFSALEDGRVDFEDGIYCLIQSYETRPLENIVAEAHKRYIDIQCLLSGEEQIGWLPAEKLKNAEQVNADCWKAVCQPELMPLSVGSFAVFFPGDGHAPNLQKSGPAHVRKAIMKVPVE